MRRRVLFAVLCLVLLSGCAEEGRTRIILKDFDNSAVGTNSVYMTLSNKFFVPSYEITQTFSTTEIPSGAVRDVVLLDIEESQTDERYYIYIFEDTDISGDATPGDEFFPVVTVSPEEGESYTLKGLKNSSEYTEGLVPDNRSFFRFNFLVNTEPTPQTPLVLLIQIATDFTPVAPDISLIITDKVLLNRHCFFLPPSTFYFLAFLDENNNGFPDIGEYASASNANSVSESFTPFVGDQEVFVIMDGTVVTSN